MVLGLYILIWYGQHFAVVSESEYDLCDVDTHIIVEYFPFITDAAF